MALTDQCDLFGSFHEQGFNRIIGHVMRQRPSLFNYATEQVARSPKFFCSRIEAHPIVSLRSNPLATITDPLPIPGTNYGVNFCAQITKLEIDFHPGEHVELPPELNPPLQKQRMAMKLTVCGGFGCPPKDTVNQFIPPPSKGSPNDRKDGPVQREIEPLPFRELICFCLDAYAIGGVRIATYDGKPYLEPFLDGIEIVDIKPEGLEGSLECYIALLLRLVVLPGLRILLQSVPLNLTQGATDLFGTPTNVILSPMPTSATLPNNPAIEDDQLKAFIKVEVI